ncbi:MAG: ABC transporter permease subunit [Candidatus Delongbacteria bacterium]|nr:ABC transporter permease subunit [Candidatus Delongbacteria bacterium]
MKMMKSEVRCRVFPSLVYGLLGLWLLIGCHQDQRTINSLEDLKGGKVFAVPSGTSADKLVLGRLPDARFIYLNNTMDCVLAVKSGKADATSYDKPVLQNILAKNEGLRLLPEMICDDAYGFAVQMGNTELKAAIDSVVAEIKRQGIYQEMLNRWLPARGNPGPMPDFDLPEINGVLRYATSAVVEPIAYVDSSQQIVGFDIELASHIAKKMGKRLEIINMEFGGMIPALASGKVDMIGAGLSITEERAKKVLFSEPYYIGGLAIVVRDDPSEDKTKTPTMILREMDDIGDKRIGVFVGTIHDGFVTQNYPEATLLRYAGTADMIMSLKGDKIDVAMLDAITAGVMMKVNPEIGFLTKDALTLPLGIGFNKNNPELRNRFNTFLAGIKADGTLDRMVDRWCKQDPEEAVMPDIPTPEQGERLKVAVAVADLPYVAVVQNHYVGFDIEMLRRFAADQGFKIEIFSMEFDALISALASGKADIIADGIAITEERQKQIDFSDPYLDFRTAVIALKKYLDLPATSRIQSIDDLKDKRIGVLMGSVYDQYAQSMFPQATILQYDNRPDLILSLKNNKIDAFFESSATLGEVRDQISDLVVVTDSLFPTSIAAGFDRQNDSLREQFNAFLAQIRQTGIYDDMVKRHIQNRLYLVPELDNQGTRGNLTVGCVQTGGFPFLGIVDGKPAGFDIEMMTRFAAYLDRKLVMEDMKFGSLIPAVTQHKVDMILSSIMITEERASKIDFSDSYFYDATALLSRQNSAVEEKRSWLQVIGNSFYSNIILENRYRLILDGLKVTVIISLLATLLGTFLGAGVCWMRMSPRRILSSLAKAFIALMRGTPVLVLLMIVFYVVFAKININPVIVAILAFGFNFAAYVSEIYRTGIESIDPGQKEAGIAGGFTRFQTFAYIILPQAVKQIVPVYKGEMISLLKTTSIVGYIAVQDLTKASDIIRSRTFDAFFPLLMVAVLYFALSGLFSLGLNYLNWKFDTRRTRNAGEN